MKRVKALFDPEGLLNPGVIFNDDPECYIKNIKPLPLTNPHVDRCIECGFCERNCLTCGFTLSSRQRIVVQREISRLRADGDSTGWLAALTKQFKYPGIQSLCRRRPLLYVVPDADKHRRDDATCAPRHCLRAAPATRPVISLPTICRLSSRHSVRCFAAGAAHAVIGDKATDAVGRGLSKIGVPMWSSAFPLAYYPHAIKTQPSEPEGGLFPEPASTRLWARARDSRRRSSTRWSL